ncbi:amidohydrolase family protein [Stakelama tenebrarum]|uniref:Amidohydrolase family protein n=1 Tax=Stakelama tenebrarum TaxID=2711215 RepID=A0A6G6Y1H3_9SPHN|nr:amidohydrolase family protein [Sphingosinithalassobacter tenebrarum]QIG78775.1 amidohydrolase family protein [Sphingosinithalassobacter tenebrarum]
MSEDGTMQGWISGRPIRARFSEGDAAPESPAPPGAVDCHHHIFDNRFHVEGQVSVPDATVADYRDFQRRLGLSRSVFVASSNYGTDDRVVLDALEQVGTDRMRAVVILHGDADAARLPGLHDRGVRGIRVYFAKGDVPDHAGFDRLTRLAADRGWSVNVVGNRDREVLIDWESAMANAPCPIMIDHMGWTPQPAGPQSATGRMLRRLLAGGNVYVKLSGPYLSSRCGAPGFDDVDALARVLAAEAPERVVWGSDWPHPVAAQQHLPVDGALLFDQLTRWIPDPARRKLALVDNPERLYWND